MKTLAIDYGKKNIGMAVSDEIGIIAMKLKGAKVRSDAEAIGKIKQVCKLEGVQQIVLGIVEKGSMRGEIEGFALELKELIHLPVIFWNEDFSSIQSEKGTSKKFKKEKSHSESARIILQEYLDSVGTKV